MGIPISPHRIFAKLRFKKQREYVFYSVSFFTRGNGDNGSSGDGDGEWGFSDIGCGDNPTAEFYDGDGSGTLDDIEYDYDYFCGEKEPLCVFLFDYIGE